MDTSCACKVDIPASEFYEIFKKYDADGNGYIESRELIRLFRDLAVSMKSGPSRDEMQKMKDEIMAEADINSDGKLQLGELANILVPKENILLKYQHLGYHKSVDVMKIWNHYDHDKSGYIDQTELMGLLGDLLQQSPGSASMQELEDFKTLMLDMFDADKDGRISMIELENILPVEDNFLKKFEFQDTVTREQFDAIVAHYDDDRSGYLDKVECDAFLHDLWKLGDSSSKPKEGLAEEIRSILCIEKDEKIPVGQLAALLLKK
ncbi:calretinin-like [Apostichopus japonicus]|uniref:calretinin-like n=1 Tax=Stichopus japonicus TaxID=307972 RepID=UPI003AB531B6